MKIAFHVVFWTIVFLEGEGSLLHPSQIYKCHRHRQWLDVPRKPLPEFPKITLVKKETLLCRYLIGIEYYIMPYGSLLMSPNSQDITCDSTNKTTATGPQRRMVQF